MYHVKDLMIIAGEPSGDLHGAALIDSLKLLLPEISFCGIGGDNMKNSGMNLNYHINRMAFMGFAEVIRHIPFIRKVERDLLETAQRKKIRHVVLIDYPGFNLRMARKFKRMGIKVIYYISPQIWAWGADRMKKIQKYVDKMIVVFPFEEELYKKNNVNVELVGHPLIERLDKYSFLSRQTLCEKFGLNPVKEILLLLPGSRENEVAKIFPESVKAAVKLADEYNLQVVTACASGIGESVFYSLTEETNFSVIKGYTYDLMKHSHFGIIKSGTSTLEAALLGLPMVVVYKTSGLTYLIGKRLVKLDNIAMVNIISGSNIVPELIQNDVNIGTIYSECKSILGSEEQYKSIKKRLNSVRELLGEKGASDKAARSIAEVINES